MIFCLFYGERSKAGKFCWILVPDMAIGTLVADGLPNVKLLVNGHGGGRG